jgi:hypothetical protein
MFTNLKQYGNPFQNVTLRVAVREATAVTVGQLMAFDTRSSVAETGNGDSPVDTGVLSLNNAIFSNIVDPFVSSGVTGGIYCVVTDLLDGAGAEDTQVEVTLQGVVEADAASAAYTVGQLLKNTGTDSNRELIAHADVAGGRPIAMCLEAATTETPLVYFYGWGGIIGGGNT